MQADLEAKIIEGVYAVGERLPTERALTEEYEVSRTSIREALFWLNMRGFIEIEGNSRPRVAMPTADNLLAQLSGTARILLGQPEGMRNLQEARTLFECSIVRHAAKYATPKQIESIEAALLSNRSSLDDPERFVETDMAFHAALVATPMNPIFTALNTALSEWLEQQRIIGMQVPGSMPRVYRDHEAIFERIRERDAEGADNAMAMHLSNVASYYNQAIMRRREQT